MEFQMNNTKKMFRVNKLVIVLFLLLSPMAGAYVACCAGHVGVVSYNKTTGKQMCTDGTTSPTCTCTKAKPKTPKQTTKSVNSKTTTNSTTSTGKTTTKPKSSWWGGKSTTTTPNNTTKSTK